MQLKEAIQKINKSKEFECNIDLEKISNIFNIEYQYHYENDDDRMKSYWMQVWICTDTFVGMKAYFLDDELVCISSQGSRKSYEEFEFISYEHANKVRDYLLSITKNDPIEYITLLDDTIDIGEGYSVNYSSEILNGSFHQFGFYKPTNEIVEIIKTYNDYIHFVQVDVKFPNKQVKEVSCRDIIFQYCNIIQK